MYRGIEGKPKEVMCVCIRVTFAMVVVGGVCVRELKCES